ncbi:response regulator [Mucilaginibacter flavus]|uniref:response regulator n=1 Tax=Mucilaginibacter flavus TaxID=931504 RepID=UPI0025B59D6F|nr:response regulator [Mucilaginibacter flavus]MDN3581289.1 response regulator [Mucilaginibacter flavus]
MAAEKDEVRICLIDDDQTFTFGFKKLINLKGLSSSLLSFNNGDQAFQWLKNPFNRRQLPDVIFLDINMPVMDGWEFMREFAELKSQLGKKIAIYVLSSSIDLNDIYRAKKIADINDYIFKPVNEFQLSEIVNCLQNNVDHKKNCRYK